MKLTLTSPQSITIFVVNQSSMIPVSAKSTSFATSQAYYCTDTGELKLYIKGEEYCFVDKESAPAMGVANSAPNDDSRITALETRVDTLYKTLYTPLMGAFGGK